MKELYQHYERHFGPGDDLYHVFAPYGVSPLGAHVDHQHGLVTGFAVDKGIDILFQPTETGLIEMVSLSFADPTIFHVEAPIYEKHFNWGDFLRGAVWVMQKEFQLKKGVRGIIRGSIPSGGVASSAALLCGFIAALAKANYLLLTRDQMVTLASRAERMFIGLTNGILDQSCVTLGERHHLLFIDTETSEHQTLPFGTFGADAPDENLPFCIGIFYSGVSRMLTNTDYNLRVQECRAAGWMLQAYGDSQLGRLENVHLRHVDRQLYDRYAPMMPPRFFRRARHFYEENERVQRGVELWQQGDIEHFGQLMFESCESSIHNYECGSPELISLYQSLRHTAGVYGARFSGAGFIGSCVALIDVQQADAVRTQVTADYLSAFPQYKDTFCSFICHSHQGLDFVDDVA
ncbi:MAG: galactokinase [Prevotella sp.]|nr:galactokinase [Prevotella sp.]